MTFEITLLLCIVAAAMLLFAYDWLSPDVVGLGVLLVLVVAGLLPVEKAFQGFGSDTVVMIASLFVLTAALSRTGVIDTAKRMILAFTGKDEKRLLLVSMIITAGLSSFISNTAATAFLLPLMLGMAEKLRISASRLLMPIAFAAILASSVTLISTSTNIVVSGVITQYGLQPLGMFELTPVGIPIVIAGILYIRVLGRRLMPDRGHPDDLVSDFGKRLYFTDLLILPGSALDGKTLAESGLGRDLDLTVLWIVRGKEHYIVPHAGEELHVGDELLVKGKKEEILKVKEKAGIDIKADFKLSDPRVSLQEMSLVEAVLLPRSPLIGRTLREGRFRDYYGVQVLALYRHGETIWQKISQIPLRIGDVLLLQGRRSKIAKITGEGEERLLHVLGTLLLEPLNPRRGSIAITIFVCALALGSLNVIPLPMAVLLGAWTALITRCITPGAAYREVEWRAVILIGSMLGLGVAIEHTGAAKLFAGWIAGWTGQAHPTWLLTGFFFLTVVLTQPMSNQAAAIVVLPVAIQTALQLQLNPRTFAVMIAIAASTSYLTPLEPSCLLVYGPGGYRFVDFLKAGLLLSVVIYGIAIVMVPWLWPLR